MSEETKVWTRMNRPLYQSGAENDEFYAYGIDGFNELLDSVIAEDILVYDRRMSAEPETVRAIVQQVTSDVINTSAIRQVICNIGHLKCGQYIQSKGNLWMVASMPDNNQIYEKAILWKCKTIIHFRSPITGEIVDYPVYNYNSTQYGTGEWQKDNINIGEAQQLVFIPYNEETIEINDRFRFIMDRNKKTPTVFRVTMVDAVAYAVGGELVHENDGILMWSVLETQFNEKTDSAEYMVADYYTYEAGESSEDTTGTTTMALIDSDGDYQIAIGESKRIDVAFDPDDDRRTFTAVITSGAEYVESIFCDADAITVKALKNRSNVGRSIHISASTTDGECTATIKIQITNP